MDNLTPITREEILLNDEPLTPITREEKILAGEDLNPVTRREYFLKKYRHAGGGVMVEGLSVTENGTYTAPSGKAYSPVEVAVPLPDNAYLLKTASGSLVSFSDGADLPMPSFICNIDAVQDLHGYDAPWVGGAGKNKLQVTATTQTVKGVTFTVNDDGTITANGTVGAADGNINFIVGEFLVDSNSCIINGVSGGSENTYYLQIVDEEATTQIGVTLDGDNTIPISANTKYKVRIRILSGVTVNNLVFKSMIRLTTETDPNFAPYSNICPISGHTGVDAVISPTTEASAGTTYSVSWQTEAGEVYGGEIDLVSGELTVTDGYIASYNGETLPSTWISDRDTYAEGTSPTTGAEVAYKMANPQTYQLGGNQIQSLLGNNNAWCSTGDIEIDYFAKEVTG